MVKSCGTDVQDVFAVELGGAVDMAVLEQRWARNLPHCIVTFVV